jgi:predicted nucleic acid-binding protein
MRVARSGAVLGIFSTRAPAQLSAVDATSFAIMKRARIRLAYAFDHHFAVVGFRLVA